MFAIEEGSEAFRTLEAMITKPDTHKISVAVQRGTDVYILLKRNEGMWTHPLPVVNAPHTLDSDVLPVQVANVLADRGWEGDR